LDHDFTRLRACEITLDRSTATATWRVDDHTLYEIHGTVIPERVQIGFEHLDDGADPERSQPLAQRAGNVRAVERLPSRRRLRLTS